MAVKAMRKKHKVADDDQIVLIMAWLAEAVEVLPALMGGRKQCKIRPGYDEASFAETLGLEAQSVSSRRLKKYGHLQREPRGKYAVVDALKIRMAAIEANHSRLEDVLKRFQHAVYSIAQRLGDAGGMRDVREIFNKDPSNG